jgi:hypothetical protein
MSIVDAIRTRSETLFALLQLLEQAEVSRDFGTHGRDGDVERLDSMTREWQVRWDGPRYRWAVVAVSQTCG